MKGDVSRASAAANLRKEDFRLKFGVKSKKTSSNALRSKNHLAWYVAFKANPSEKMLSGNFQIKWKCPPKLVLDPGWHVACGEESFEVDAQKRRETSVTEAVYPHLSAIPPSPLVSPGMEGKHDDDDDSQIPLIPIVPIEEAGAIEMPFNTSAPVKTFNCHSTSESRTLSRCDSSVSPNPPTGKKSLLNVLHGLEGNDLAVAASAGPGAGAAVTVSAVMESKHELDTELLIKYLTNPEMMKTLINETRIGADTESRFPSGPKSATYPLSSNSTPDPGVNTFVPMAMNQLIPMKESASDLGWSPAPLRSDSHSLLIQDSTNEAREPAIVNSRTHSATGTNEPRPLTAPILSYNENQHARLINQYGVANAAPPLYPSFSKPNLEAANKPMVKQHLPPFFAGIKPVSSPPPFSSTWRPYEHCTTDGYRALDHAGLKPCLGLNPSMPSPLQSNFTSSGTFHACPFPSMNRLPSPVQDINYCKSLIKQHGENHVRNEDKLPKYGQPSNHLHELELAQHTNPLQINPTFQKPCMFFNSPNGCRKGSSCQYTHAMSRRWMANGVQEGPVANKMNLSQKQRF
ncbi:zinc finger CCCH domain-containing protein 45-like [Primulina tabacum]|uniref:zinc finger CCCH domain-containing protein 45-like n=1 Tax=Primulina tabacum TaxID=48773 RepID=UPI003F5A16E0